MLDFTKKPQQSRGGISFLFGVTVAFTAMLALVFAMGQATAHDGPYGLVPVQPITITPLASVGTAF